jgi:hypothetical protein
MPDEIDRISVLTGEADDRRLAEALRALPLLSPARSALPAVLALSGKRTARTHRHLPGWMAWAAGLMVIGLGLFLFNGQAIDAERTTAADVGASADLQALMQRSLEWETALRRLEQQSMPMDAGTAMASAELEDLISLTDLQLGATENDEQAQSLWERRIRLMSRLAEVRTQPAWDKAFPDQSPTLLSATYPIN